MTGRAKLATALAAGLAALCIAPAGPAAGAVAVPGEHSAFDLDRALTALRSDPVYVAPGATARLDHAIIERALAGTADYVVLAAPEPSYSDFLTSVMPRLPGHGNGIVVVGLRSYSLVSLGGGQVERRHLREVLESSDVTGVILDLLALDRDKAPATPIVAPRSIPADPAQLRRLVAALRANRFYVDPAVTAKVARDAYEDQRLTGVPYRVAVLPALAPRAPEPRLLPGLATAFPGQLVIVIRGRWPEATGPDGPQRIDQAVRYAVGSNLDDLMENGNLADVAYSFLRRVVDLRQVTSHRRPALAGAGNRNSGRVAPWAFAVAALLLLGASGAGWAWRAARLRRATARDVRVAQAQLFARLARLGADVRTLDAGGDAGAQRRLAEAAERQQTATDLLEHARSPAELAVVRATVDEGLSLADDAHQRIHAAAAATPAATARPRPWWRRW